MKRIVFAWMTPALVAGRKTCTCRDWDGDYAQRFRVGDVIAAYDRSPRYRGTQIATLRLTHDATHGRPIDVLGGFDAAYEAEGFAYGDERLDVRSLVEGRGAGMSWSTAMLVTVPVAPSSSGPISGSSTGEASHELRLGRHRQHHRDRVRAALLRRAGFVVRAAKG